MAAVCQSVQIQMYVCNLSKDFSLSMILVMSDTLYQYIPDPRISELRSLILHSCMSSQDLVDSEITCPSTVEQENCAPRRAAGD